MSRVVLLAEQDVTTRNALSRALARAGLLPIEVADGRDALACLCRPGLGVDVAVLAADLPGMDAAEIISLMRAHTRLRHVPTIVLAAPSSPWDGHPMTLQKPVDASELLLAVGALLPPPSMAA